MGPDNNGQTRLLKKEMTTKLKPVDEADEKCAMVEMREINSRADKSLFSSEDSPYIISNNYVMDMNLYSTKKIISQGMLDIALLTANASQLKHVIKGGVENNPFHGVNVACLTISIILQLAIGILLIISSRYNINIISHQPRAEFMSNLIIIGAFLITISNVFMSAFGTT